MDQLIPASLAERRRWVVAPDQTDHPPGEMVLYWIHNAVRGHENPALDAAIWMAHQTGLPLLVYHGLSEKYPYASDRHHAFIMQGARDVQRELQARGITYAFHLERHGHRGPHLRDLCRRAAVLVSEEMPVAPIACWVERLRSLVTTPIMLV
ncbi:deoxyribodipyrimidine photo-lyase, partial [Rhodopirellula bahusiensis]